MVVYISLPITGFPLAEAKRKAEAVKVEIASHGHDVITPFDVCPEEDMSYSYYMGKDIMALLECDAVYFLHGWEKSKGCLLEYSAARIYGKRTMFEKTQRKDVEKKQDKVEEQSIKR